MYDNDVTSSIFLSTRHIVPRAFNISTLINTFERERKDSFDRADVDELQKQGQAVMMAVARTHDDDDGRRNSRHYDTSFLIFYVVVELTSMTRTRVPTVQVKGWLKPISYKMRVSLESHKKNNRIDPAHRPFTSREPKR